MPGSLPHSQHMGMGLQAARATTTGPALSQLSNRPRPHVCPYFKGSYSRLLIGHLRPKLARAQYRRGSKALAGLGAVDVKDALTTPELRGEARQLAAGDTSQQVGITEVEVSAMGTPQIPREAPSTKELLRVAKLSFFPSGFDVEDAKIALGTDTPGAQLALNDLEQGGLIRKMRDNVYCHMPEIIKSLPAHGIPSEEKSAAALRYVMHWSARLREWDADYLKGDWFREALESIRRHEAKVKVMMQLASDPDASAELCRLVASTPSRLTSTLLLAYSPEWQAMCRNMLAKCEPGTAAHAASLSHLAAWHMRWHHPDVAEPLLRQSLAEYESVLGPEHPDSARVAVRLADCLLQLDTDKNRSGPCASRGEAVRLSRKAASVLCVALGEKHADALEAAAVSALSTVTQPGGSAAAINQLENICKTAREYLDWEHPVTLECQVHLARGRFEMGFLDTAKFNFNQTHEQLHKVFGWAHPLATEQLAAEAACLRADGEDQKATEKLLIAYVRMHEELGEDHMLTAYYKQLWVGNGR